MSIRGITVRLTVLALAVAVLVPVGQVEVTAVPVTQSEQLDGLPSIDGPPSNDAADADDGGNGRFGTASQGSDDEGTDDEGTDDEGTAEAAAEAPATSTSQIVEAPLTFNSVGVRAPDEATAVRVRTSEDGESWSDWESLAFLDATDGPDAGTAEEREAEPGQHTVPLWADEANYLQFEVDGAATEDLDVTVIDSMGLSGGPVERSWETHVGSAADADTLDIVHRDEWGADESLGSDKVTIADEVHMGIVHHTAHTSGDEANSYSQSEAPAIMRAMHRYHTEALGWRDLGYNVVIDRFGTVYEGRKGGFANGVVGAHAAGYNTGSFGVSVIGNFTDEQASSAALEALTEVVGIKSAIHGIDPTGWTDQMGGSWKPTVLGHRDVGQTVCPGKIHDELPQIRDAAADQSILFPDVATDSPHRESILRLALDGVTTGCRANEFCPSDALSRAQASAFVLRAFELDPVPGSQFPDVPEDHIHASSINALVERGWLRGYPDGTFRPWDKMTRGQLATLLWRASELPEAQPMLNHYPDVSIFSTHAPGIYALYDGGIRGNCGSGNFCPDDLALRDSTANFVDQVREHLRLSDPDNDPEDAETDHDLDDPDDDDQ